MDGDRLFLAASQLTACGLISNNPSTQKRKGNSRDFREFNAFDGYIQLHDTIFCFANASFAWSFSPARSFNKLYIKKFPAWKESLKWTWTEIFSSLTTTDCDENSDGSY